MTLTEFQEKYRTKEDKIEAVRTLSNAEIDEIIDSCDNIYGKIFYSRLKEMDQIAGYSEKHTGLNIDLRNRI